MSELVLLTGISGFIAKHVALELLRQGYQVRGTVRQKAAGDAVTATLRAAGADTTGLSFIEADLTKDDGWQEAAKGCRYVQHLASPFPLKQPKEREGLIPMAVGGTARVLDAALRAGAERVVLTSSIVSMMYRAGRAGDLPLRESDWTDTDWPGANPYAISKTRAEQEAWRIMRAAGAETRLAVVNPGLVLGPLLDRDFGTSVNVIKLMLDGKYPAIPPINFPVVDVRDLALVHVRAMTLAEAGGRRLLSAGGRSPCRKWGASSARHWAPKPAGCRRSRCRPWR